MKPFQAFRYLNKQKVRAIYDDETHSWWYSAMDVVHVLTGSDNSRRYWNTFKGRHFYNYYLYKKLKVRSNDLKEYAADVLKEEGIGLVVKLLPKIHILNYEDVVKELQMPFNDLIFSRCNDIYDGLMINPEILFTTKAAIHIQTYLFDIVNNQDTVFRNPLAFDDELFIKEILVSIDFMGYKKIDEIINKFIEFILLRPFTVGNYLTSLIWLDLMIRHKYKKCINYSLIDKQELLDAINISHTNPTKLYGLIKGALSLEIDNLELRTKNINYLMIVGKNQVTT